eukprot:6175131-Pleurochrysis_carterae.AAC.1
MSSSTGGGSSCSAGVLVLCTSGVSLVVSIEKSGCRCPSCCAPRLLALVLPVFPMASPRGFACGQHRTDT